MKPATVKPERYIDFRNESNFKKSKFKVNDHARILFTENLTEVVVDTSPSLYVIWDFNGEDITGT